MGVSESRGCELDFLLTKQWSAFLLLGYFDISQWAEDDKRIFGHR